MRGTVDEVIFSGQSYGSRQRELSVLSSLDKVLGARNIDSFVYFAYVLLSCSKYSAENCFSSELLTFSFQKHIRYHDEFFLQYTVPRAIKRAGLVSSISHYTKYELCEAYGTPPEK